MIDFLAICGFLVFIYLAAQGAEALAVRCARRWKGEE